MMNNLMRFLKIKKVLFVKISSKVRFCYYENMPRAIIASENFLELCEPILLCLYIIDRIFDNR